MKTLDQKLQDIETLVAVKSINGTSFVGVRNYKSNSTGEVSNQTFLVGINYANLLKSDLETLKQFDIKPLFKSHDKELVKEAYSELLTSLTKRTASELEKAILREAGDKTIKQSDAQNNAYVNLANGLKTKDDALYIYGLCVRKEVLVEGVHKQVNSREKTIVKNKIKKQANLKDLKYRNFKLGELEKLRIQGLEI